MQGLKSCKDYVKNMQEVLPPLTPASAHPEREFQSILSSVPGSQMARVTVPSPQQLSYFLLPPEPGSKESVQNWEGQA